MIRPNGLIRIGTAGWQVPRAVRDRFPEAASGLERYAAVFDCVEINSSFYRPHQPKTYARWAAATPPDFRFAVKLPKLITHELKLVDFDQPLARFLGEATCLGDKLGPILVQLPGALAFDPNLAEPFFTHLRREIPGPIVFEPRHPSWFRPEPEALLKARQIARVAADPPRAPGADSPGGWRGVDYWRLHGSPSVYWSAYEPPYLDALAADLRQSVEAWCIFDNTASGAATANGLDLLERLKLRP